jgi:hypothetical protein
VSGVGILMAIFGEWGACGNCYGSFVLIAASAQWLRGFDHRVAHLWALHLISESLPMSFLECV